MKIVIDDKRLKPVDKDACKLLLEGDQNLWHERVNFYEEKIKLIINRASPSTIKWAEGMAHHFHTIIDVMVAYSKIAMLYQERAFINVIVCIETIGPKSREYLKFGEMASSKRIKRNRSKSSGQSKVAKRTKRLSESVHIVLAKCKEASKRNNEGSGEQSNHGRRNCRIYEESNDDSRNSEGPIESTKR